MRCRIVSGSLEIGVVCAGREPCDTTPIAIPIAMALGGSRLRCALPIGQQWQLRCRLRIKHPPERSRIRAHQGCGKVLARLCVREYSSDDGCLLHSGHKKKHGARAVDDRQRECYAPVPQVWHEDRPYFVILLREAPSASRKQRCSMPILTNPQQYQVTPPVKERKYCLQFPFVVTRGKYPLSVSPLMRQMCRGGMGTRAMNSR